jgi:hypothetical protein
LPGQGIQFLQLGVMGAGQRGLAEVGAWRRLLYRRLTGLVHFHVHDENPCLRTADYTQRSDPGQMCGRKTVLAEYGKVTAQRQGVL